MRHSKTLTPLNKVGIPLALAGVLAYSVLNRRRQAQEAIRMLERLQYVDLHTRIVTIEFTIYNPHVSQVRLCV